MVQRLIKVLGRGNGRIDRMKMKTYKLKVQIFDSKNRPKSDLKTIAKFDSKYVLAKYIDTYSKVKRLTVNTVHTADGSKIIKGPKLLYFDENDNIHELSIEVQEDGGCDV